jgi:hypothetical protein
VRHTRAPWIRGLRLYRLADDNAALDARGDEDVLTPLDGHVHARSLFRSARHPGRYAEYSVHDPGDGLDELSGPGDHHLVVVREFRRVPLQASALGLVLFAARAGREAQVIATLAHFAERALSLYQPPYLLLARSLEQPGISVLVAGVQAGAMLESGGAAAFSVERLLPEITPLLSVEPEWYSYAPDPTPASESASLFAAVSPTAV